MKFLKKKFLENAEFSSCLKYYLLTIKSSFSSPSTLAEIYVGTFDIYIIYVCICYMT